MIEIGKYYICKKKHIHWSWVNLMDEMVGKPLRCINKSSLTTIASGKRHEDTYSIMEYVSCDTKIIRHTFMDIWLTPIEEGKKDTTSACKCNLWKGCTCGAIKPYKIRAREMGIWI